MHVQESFAALVIIATSYASKDSEVARRLVVRGATPLREGGETVRFMRVRCLTVLPVRKLRGG